jgi:hypothetical protein
MMNAMRRSCMRLLPLGGVLLLAVGCTGATTGSGVGDRMILSPPYYAGRAVPVEGGPIGHLPITYQRGATHEALFDPAAEPDSPVAKLLAEMNEFLDGLGLTVPVAAAAATVGTPPDVMFGCFQDAAGECQDPESVDSRGPRMRLAVGRPSGSWVSWYQGELDGAGSPRALLITLEVGQYWPRQKNWRGSKEVELGSDYAVDIPWLTALDRPVLVLQLTGALLDRDGKAVRIGAEGMLARRTNVALAGFGVQSLIGEEDVERLRGSRREELPGQPLVWEAALRNLLAELTGRPDLAIR